MAPSSPRSVRPPRGPPCLVAPRSSPQDADASPDTPRSLPPGPDPLLSRLEAVDRDAARRKFALYGRQHAHVDHLSGADQDKTIVLQSTMLLQEDGLLAARLDDVTYLLDGLLEPATMQRGRLAQTRSVLELTQLLQDPQILQAVELSSQRRRIQSRVKELLVSKLGEAEGEASRVSLAVLVYFLSGSSEEYFDDTVLDAVVHALKQEVEKGEKIQEHGEMKRAVVADVVTQRAVTKKKKTCLTRKQPGKTGASAVEERKVSAARSTIAESTAQVLDDFCRMRLDELLNDHTEFYVDGELQISVVGTLCAALHNLLQVDGSSSNSSAGLTQRPQHQRSAQLGDAADDTFQRIRARKRQLLRNGGLDILMRGLAKQLSVLEVLLPSTHAKEVTVECAHSLHHVGMLLCVFDQVTFLTMDVQQYISKQRHFFGLLLKLTRLLSELSWGAHAPKRWEAEPMRVAQTVEVLLSGLRVLINLTHHSTEAASHVHALDGMQLLANAFSQLRCMATPPAIAEKHSPAQDKWEFDSSLLLLSVIVNSIEFSDENRDALARASLYQEESSRDNDAMTSQARLRACDLFMRFFLAKLQSYKHLIDVTEAQGANGAISIEEEGDDWNPEDVILGGCTSLLLGYLMKGSTANTAVILESLPDSSPRLLLRALGVFVALHSQIGALTPEVAKSVLNVEKVLKSCQGRQFIAEESGLLEEVTGVYERQHDVPINTSPATKSEETDVDLSSTMSIEDSAESQTRHVSPPLRPRSLKNVCSYLDDSDEDTVPHVQVQDNAAGSKANRRLGSHCQAFGMRSPTRTPLRSPGKKRTRENSAMKTPPVSQTSGKSPMRACRSSPFAVLPDGSLSSPVVARLLKRTRQLVDEFDAEFAKSTPSTPMKMNRRTENGTTATEKSPSPRIVLTTDVTCRYNGSDGLDLTQDIGKDNSTNVGTKGVVIDQEILSAGASKRRKKPTRDPDTSTKRAIVHQGSSFDFVSSNTSPSTSLCMKKSSVLLQTPTRAGPSPGLYRQSPSLNLTPTKSSPSTPMRMKTSSGLLRTPTRNDRPASVKESPTSASPHRRKAKTVRVPASTRASSIFDFTD
ncbi:hypothetical protein PHYPSEUDO_013281 [Phytophthora pseudosyringae]|uniref:Wings apart-like protein C-terminal domain-containing protein n=1 Tax=Phytophthora pseudosyringae TaxID=221518 RepID=A0A8T1W8J7_9STRA|nr:hypothetical protein PHYPSEUDO_013281 [Phytophthora pseudosyringae]